MSKAIKPVPIVIPDELAAAIDRVAKLTQMSKAEVMRLAMKVGLEDLRRIGYNLAGAIVDAARASKPQASPQTQERTAPANFTTLTSHTEPPFATAADKPGESIPMPKPIPVRYESGHRKRKG